MNSSGLPNSLLDVSSPKHGNFFSVAYPERRLLPGRQWRSSAGSVLVVVVVVTATLATLGLWTLLHSPDTGIHRAPGGPLQAAQTSRYVLVIDSGSSGTRMYAYKWAPPGQGSPLPLVQALPPSAAPHLIPKRKAKGVYNRVETQPGLDQFADDPAQLADVALGPLLAWARAVVPVDQHTSSPVFLMGTGGLRRLQDSKRQLLMQHVRNTLSKSGFRFQPSFVKVLSGQDEGAYGWLSLNYQEQRLHHSSSRVGSKSSSGSSSSSRTFGALDLGGSSLELTLEQPDHPDLGPSRGSSASSNAAAAAAVSSKNITVAGVTYLLHTHTFHHYGLNEAFDRGVTLLWQQQQQLQEQQQQQQQQQKSKSVQQQEHHVQGAQQNATEHAGKIDRQDTQTHQGPAESSKEGQAPKPSHQEQQQQQQLHSLADSGAGNAASTVNASSPRPAAQPVTSLAEQQQRAEMAMAAAAGLLPVIRSSMPEAANGQQQPPPPQSPLLQQPPLQQQQQALQGSALTTKPSSVVNNMSGGGSGGGRAGPAEQSASLDSAAHANQHIHSSSSPQSDEARSHSRTLKAGRGTSQPHQELQPTGRGLRVAGDVARSAGTSGQPEVHLAQLQQKQLHSQRRRHLRTERLQLLRHQPSHLLEGGQAAQVVTVTPPSALQAAMDRDQQQQQRLTDEHNLGRWSDFAQPALKHRHLLQGTYPALTPGSPSPADAATLAAPRQHMMPPGSSSTTGTGSHSSSNSKPDSGRTQHVDKVAGDTGAPQSGLGGHPVIVHPCLHDGFEAEYLRIPFHGTLPQPPQVLLRGSFDWHSCLQLVDLVVNASAPCAVGQLQPHKPLCRLGAAQPTLEGTFLAMTGFYVVAKFLQLPDGAPLDQVLAAGEQLCRRPWSWVQQHLDGHVNVEKYCTWAPYTVKLLREGLRLRDEQIHTGSGDYGWPLGAALVEASALPDMMQALANPLAQAVSRKRPWKGRWRRSEPMSSLGRVGGGSTGDAVGGEAAGDDALLTSPESSAGAWQYIHRRSWAERLWSARRHLHAGHLGLLLVGGVIWLVGLMWYRRIDHVGTGASALALLPVSVRGLYGPGKAQQQFMALNQAMVRGRSPNVRWTAFKYLGVKGNM